MTSSENSFKAFAPAKINLWLAVHGRRADGYHELTTLMLALALGDELRARPSASEGIGLRVQGPQASSDIPTDGSNLVCRSARAVLERARELGREVPAGIEFELTKNVPSQGGLGGGSSDAVSALGLAERIAGVDLGEEWRREFLARLGADCVFFHDLGPSGAALCEGIGELVTPWEGSPPAWTIALIVPDLPCPTASVFAELELSGGAERMPPFATLFQAQSADTVRELLHNDLEGAALACLPALEAWRQWLDQAGAQHFRLSGSGSTFFGLYDEEETAKAQLELLVEGARARGLALRGHFLSVAYSS